MGFSVSGSLVVVLLGLFIALSAFYGSASNALERVHDAGSAHTERMERIHEGALNITEVSLLSDATCGVRVRVNNTGSTAFDLNETSLLFGNDYRTGWQAGATVDGDTIDSEPGTDLWLPTEQVTIEQDGLGEAPDSVKVVSSHGIADTKEVSDLIC